MNLKSLILLPGLLAGSLACTASTTNFFTGFETSAGYSTRSPLVGTQGWVGLLSKPSQTTNAAADGNGIISGVLPTQAAYIGLTPIPGTYSNLTLWQPLGSIAANATNVTFSTEMEILDGDGGASFFDYDTFLWKVYNAQSNLLFAIRFDENLAVPNNFSYCLSASNSIWYPIPNGYASQLQYSLALTMNPASNIWTLQMDGSTWVGPQPMAAAGTSLSIGYVAASWELTTPGSPGDNRMVFDNVLITSALGTAPTPSRPQMAVRSVSPVTGTVVRLTGDNGYKFALDATTNLATATWTGLVTNTMTTNFFDYNDSGAIGQPRRSYRGRWVP